MKILNVAERVQSVTLNSMKKNQVFALIKHTSNEISTSEYTVLELTTMLRIYDILFTYLLIADTDLEIKYMMIEFALDRIGDLLD